MLSTTFSKIIILIIHIILYSRENLLIFLTKQNTKHILNNQDIIILILEFIIKVNNYNIDDDNEVIKINDIVISYKDLKTRFSEDKPDNYDDLISIIENIKEKEIVRIKTNLPNINKFFNFVSDLPSSTDSINDSLLISV